MHRLALPLAAVALVLQSACCGTPGARSAPTPRQDEPAPPRREPAPERPEATPPPPPAREPTEPRTPEEPPQRREPQTPEEPERREPRRRPQEPLIPQEPVEPERVWVCHGIPEARWLAVSPAQAESHRRHGDPVSAEPQDGGAPCERGAAERPERREPREPEQPIEPREPREPDRPREPRDPREPTPEQRFAWVCHGEENPRWLRVAIAAVDAHRRHGDPVSPDPQEVGTSCARAEEEPQEPRPPDEPRDPGRPGEPGEPDEPPSEPRFAWVCHGEENPHWLRVPIPAVDAHRRHGDPVSPQPQEVGTSCERAEEEPQEPRRPDEPRDPGRPGEPDERPTEPRFAWVCHGEENPRWLRVAVAAVDAHRRHGDPVSLEPQEAGTSCERPQGGPPERE